MYRVVFVIAVLSLASATARAADSSGPKPVITQDRDEPGRSPYQSSLDGLAGKASCSFNACDVVFSPVPAGKRLVVTNVHLLLPPPLPDDIPVLLTDDHFDFIAALPIVSTGRGVVGGGPVTTYIEALRSPILQFRIAPGETYNAMISGYLVSLP